MVHLIYTHEPARKLKHVIAQGDDDELSVLGALLDVGGHDRDLACVSRVDSRKIANGGYSHCGSQAQHQSHP